MIQQEGLPHSFVWPYPLLVNNLVYLSIIPNAFTIKFC